MSALPSMTRLAEVARANPDSTPAFTDSDLLSLLDSRWASLSAHKVGQGGFDVYFDEDWYELDETREIVTPSWISDIKGERRAHPTLRHALQYVASKVLL